MKALPFLLLAAASAAFFLLPSHLELAMSLYAGLGAIAVLLSDYTRTARMPRLHHTVAVRPTPVSTFRLAA